MVGRLVCRAVQAAAGRSRAFPSLVLDPWEEEEVVVVKPWPYQR